jgi:hypothetical protein
VSTDYRRPEEEESIFKLSQIEVEGVHAVDAGDNPGAKIVLTKRAQQKATLEELCKSAADSLELAEISKLQTRADAQRALEIITKRLRDADPTLSEGEAYRMAMNTEHGQAIRKRALEELPAGEAQPLKKHRRVQEMEEEDERGRTLGRAVSSTIEKRADQIEKDAVERGRPVSPTEAYKKAMAEEGELVKEFRKRF